MSKVLLGMSGGVDSSVSAYLLQKSGYEVIGLYFKIDNRKTDLTDLDAVCKRLGITYYVEDFQEIFNKNVFTPFIEDYKNGKTPNICVACNKYIKFGALVDKAKQLNCDFVATGHYCALENKDGKVFLKKSKDDKKDQTYFLNNVSATALTKVIFPLANLTKEDVRKIAQDNNIPTAEKKDSSDVCIAGDKKFSQFINQIIEPNCGDIITDNGEKVGTHKGLHNYTLGQRKGLNLGGKSGEDGRWFVFKKDVNTNTLYVSHGTEDKLFATDFIVKDLNFITPLTKNEFKCMVKTRYRTAEKPATVTVKDGVAYVHLDLQERAITVGQYAVFYLDDYCLGGGRIDSVIQ